MQPVEHPIHPRDVVLLALSIAFQTAAIAAGKEAALTLPRFAVELIARNPFYLLSLACLGLQAVVWQLTLSKFPLSLAYAAMSIVYVNVLLLSAFVFHEHVSVSNIAGAALIIAGVALMTHGRERATIA